jgi:hypothetical protein
VRFLLICTCLLGGGLSAWSNLPAFELSWQMAGKAETCEESDKEACRQRRSSTKRLDQDSEQQDMVAAKSSKQILSS